MRSRTWREGRAPRAALLLIWTAVWAMGAAGLLAGLFMRPVSGEEPAARRAVVLEAKGIVSPPYAQYLVREIDAAQGKADLIILEMDTPGGLVTSMQDIVRAILASDVPVATYVSPSGASALSAGTYIAYASHIAAMAPGTNIGAATPVSLGGPEPTPVPEPAPEEESAPDTDEGGKATEGDKTAEGGDKAEDAKKDGQKTEGKPEDESKETEPDTALELKAVNAYVAYIRSLAEFHGRNAEWAEKAVREAASLTASAALEQKVIDIVARDIPDLLAQADGRTVRTHDGEATVKTAGAKIERVEVSLIARILIVLADPNIAFLLMNIGTIGLLMEVYNPGSIFPGVVGAICLILGLYSLSVLPTNYAGVALFFLGAAFLGLEFFVPSGGILGVGGVISMGVGAFILFDTDIPGLKVSWPFLAGTLGVTVFLVFIAGTYALAAQRRKIATGADNLIGMTGRVIRWSGSEGIVHADGETWRARSEDALAEGQEVVIKALDGLVLVVVAKTERRKKS